MIKKWRLYAFAAVLLAATVFQVSQIRASRIRMSHWIGGASFGAFVSQLYFPNGGYAAIAFDTEAAFNSFASMPQVDVVLTKAPIRTTRSEVVVEASK